LPLLDEAVDTRQASWAGFAGRGAAGAPVSSARHTASWSRAYAKSKSNQIKSAELTIAPTPELW